MSVYTSLRSSSSSLYGSIEESESVSVSCKVVNRRQWFLWWSDLIRFNCFYKTNNNLFIFNFFVSKKMIKLIFITPIPRRCIQIQMIFFMAIQPVFYIVHFPSCRHLALLIIDLGMWDMTEIHNINRIKI